MAQWSIYIDIEGFGATYEAGSQCFVSLGALMAGIYALGTTCFRESPDRIFAHQVGDGFIVVSEFPSPTLEVPVSVAVLLLRQIALAGGAGKAAIAEGGFADVVGCFPKVIRDAMGSTRPGAFALGGGVMTVFPVMGTALINAYRLISARTAPSGPLLLVRGADIDKLPAGLHVNASGGYAVVDWVHADLPRVREMATVARMSNPNSEASNQLVKRYIAENKVTPEWRSNAIRFLNLEKGADK